MDIEKSVNKVECVPIIPYFLIISLGLFVVLALSLFFLWRIDESKTGICKTQGRVLTEHELRQAVLQNLVNIDVEATNVHERLFNTDRDRTGIVRIAPEVKIDQTEYYIKSLVEKSHNNKLSFEENFSVEVIAPGHGIDVSRLEEPFVLVTYSTDTGGALFIFSTDVRQVPPPNWASKVSLYARFQGFGNHYYRIKCTSIDLKCCDNRTYPYRFSHDEHLAKKEKAYLGSLRNIDSKLAVHDRYVAISNCGDIPTENSDNGMDQYFVKFMHKGD